MKVLVITHRIPYPLKDGGAIGMFNFIKGLGQQGAEVTLLSLNAKKFNIDTAEAQKAISPYARFAYTDIDTGIKPLDAFLNLFTSKSYNMERFRSRRFGRLITETMQRGQFDIVNMEGSFVSMYLPLVRSLTKVPVISRQPNVEWEIWERLAQNETSPLKRWYIALLARRMKTFEVQHMPAFDEVYAITDSDAAAFRGIGCKRVTVLQVAMDLDRYTRSYPPAEWPTVFHLAFMEWLPNQEALTWLLDEVWPLVQDQMPQARLIACGMKMPDYLLQRSGGHITIGGEVEDAIEFIYQYGVMAVPLWSGSGTRIKILEGMACGKPIVTTSVGLQGIPATPGEHIFVADTPAEFASALLTLLQDREAALEMAERARIWVKQIYGLAAVSNRQLEMYQQIINDKKQA